MLAQSRASMVVTIEFGVRRLVWHEVPHTEHAAQSWWLAALEAWVLEQRPSIFRSLQLFLLARLLFPFNKNVTVSPKRSFKKTLSLLAFTTV